MSIFSRLFQREDGGTPGEGPPPEADRQDPAADRSLTDRDLVAVAALEAPPRTPPPMPSIKQGGAADACRLRCGCAT
jgi:hypothetical protein